MPLAFGRHMKMRKTDEFSSVFRFRCQGRDAGLVVMAAPNGLAHARLGLIIPKRIINGAVQRNRVKRLLREDFRLRQHELRGFDIIASLQADVADDALRSAFGEALRRCQSCLRRRLGDAVPSPAA